MYNTLRTLTYVWQPCKEHTNRSPIHFNQFLLPPLLPLVSQALQHICKVQQVSAISWTHTSTYANVLFWSIFFEFLQVKFFFADIAHFTLSRKEPFFQKISRKKPGNNKNLPPKKSLCCMQFSLYLYISPRPCYVT